MKKFLLAAIVIYSLIFVTACPTKSNLEQAFNQSARVANLAETSALTVADLYRAGVINLETKDKIAKSLRLVVDNGKRFHEVLSKIKEKYKGDVNNFSAEDKSALDLIFNQEVIAPFAEILTELRVLPENAAKQILTAIALLKTAILTVSNIFGHGSLSYKFYAREVNANV